MGRNNDEDDCCCRVSVAEMSDRVRRVDGKEGPTSSHGKQKCTSPNKQRRKKKKGKILMSRQDMTMRVDFVRREEVEEPAGSQPEEGAEWQMSSIEVGEGLEGGENREGGVVRGTRVGVELRLVVLIEVCSGERQVVLVGGRRATAAVGVVGNPRGLGCRRRAQTRLQRASVIPRARHRQLRLVA